MLHIPLKRPNLYHFWDSKKSIVISLQNYEEIRKIGFVGSNFSKRPRILICRVRDIICNPHSVAEPLGGPRPQRLPSCCHWRPLMDWLQIVYITGVRNAIFNINLTCSVRNYLFARYI